MTWACQQHGAPPVYHFVSALAVACQELARHGFTLATGQPMSIWFALIGDSASGKSAAIDMVDDFVHTVWEDAPAPVIDPWVEVSGSIAGILSAVQEHYSADRGTTVCMLYAQELSGVFATREAIPEFLCSLADGRTIQRNLRELQQRAPGGARPRGRPPVVAGGRPDRVFLPTTCGLFATVERRLSEVFTEGMQYGGLFSRLWWVKPPFDPSMVRLRGPTDFAAERAAAAAQWVTWLVGLQLHEGRQVTFGEAAWALLQDELFKPNMERCQADDPLNATRIRVVDKAQVFAAVFALMAGRTTVEYMDMHRAVMLAKRLLGYARDMQDLGSSDLLRSTSRALRHITACGEKGASRRELYRALHREKRIVDLVIETLVDRGEVLEDRSQRTPNYYAIETEHAKAAISRAESRTYDFGNVLDLRKRG
jgi:hypothetical protein